MMARDEIMNKSAHFIHLKLYGLLSACLLLVFAALAPHRASAAEPIEVGVAASLTGFLASYDSNFVSGLKLAAEDVNKRGGVLGRPINLTILDNASNATTGVTVTNQLINQNNITVMLNGLSSSQNAAINPILAKAKIPMIIASAILPNNPIWAFQISAPSRNVLALQLDFAKEQLGASKIAFLYSNTPYGQDGARFIEQRAKELNLNVVLSEPIEPAVTDLSPQMSKVKSLSPDVVLDLLTGSTHIVEAKAASTVALKVPLIMALDDQDVLLQSSESYGNTFSVVQPVQAYPSIDNPQLRAEVEGFLAKFDGAKLDRKTVAGVANGWDAIGMLVAAINAAGTAEGEKLRAAIETLNYVGPSGLFSFSSADHTGQPPSKLSLQIGSYVGGHLQIKTAAR
jgi:branched-chain amino acid transport system substrate-binding protein